MYIIIAELHYCIFTKGRVNKNNILKIHKLNYCLANILDFIYKKNICKKEQLSIY